MFTKVQHIQPNLWSYCWALRQTLYIYIFIYIIDLFVYIYIYTLWFCWVHATWAELRPQGHHAHGRARQAQRGGEGGANESHEDPTRLSFRWWWFQTPMRKGKPCPVLRCSGCLPNKTRHGPRLPAELQGYSSYCDSTISASTFRSNRCLNLPNSCTKPRATGCNWSPFRFWFATSRGPSGARRAFCACRRAVRRPWRGFIAMPMLGSAERQEDLHVCLNAKQHIWHKKTHNITQ